MRVTFILPGYARKPVGGYKIVYEYANRLVERGHDVAVVHPRRVKHPMFQQSLYSVLRGGVAYYARSLFKSRPRWQPTNKKIKMLFVPEPKAKCLPKADVVFVTLWPLVDYMLNYPRSLGEKVYLFQHYEIWSGPKNIVDSIWRSTSIKKVVVSKWLYEIGRTFGCNDAAYIPNGLDFEHYRIVNPIERRSPIVAMMYSEQAWKGSRDGIEALLLAKKKFPELQAILFGVGKKRRGLPDWIEYWRDPEQNTLVECIYNNSSIFLCPSHTEGFALPPAEAMACGCAVVTTDCGGVMDFAEDGVTALVSPPRNAEALAENLLKLLKSNELRIKLAKMGHKRIQQFTWENAIDKFETFILASTNYEQ